MRIAVIGGGLAGLSCAIRLAQKDQQVALFEAAPELGGRTRSFLDPTTGTWVDNGPHLLIGAYSATRKLLREAGAEHHVHWQSRLQLPLWDRDRGMFILSPSATLPLALAMPLACTRLPGHGMASLSGTVRLAWASHRPVHHDQSVASWLDAHAIPTPLRRDILDPLCLGAMNESSATANARSFARVLHDAFSNHDAARLGWFRMPLSQALISPLKELALRLKVEIHQRARIRRIDAGNDHIDLETAGGGRRQFDAAILALPSRARNILLGWPQVHETRAITNIHLWFKQSLRLPQPLIGGIGTYGQWFFDIIQQMESDDRQGGHICAVISADQEKIPEEKRVDRVCRELGEILGMDAPPEPDHHRIVREHRATTLVRHATGQPPLPPRLLDASEQPLPGDLPATIEWAIQRGEKAAKTVLTTFSN